MKMDWVGFLIIATYGQACLWAGFALGYREAQTPMQTPPGVQCVLPVTK